MNQIAGRPLAIGPLRAFEAVARRLSFHQAADELHLTQSAVSRQVKALEDEVGARLLERGTRHVDLTPDGAILLRAVAPALHRLDAAVRQIRQAHGRRSIAVSTFASFASMWLIPRLPALQRELPEVDLRVSTSDAYIEVDGLSADAALRHATATDAGPDAHHLFDEVVTPVASPWLVERARRGDGPALESPADLALHTLIVDDDPRPSVRTRGWERWLSEHGADGLEPRSRLFHSYAVHQVQSAAAGHGLALARLPLVVDALERGELVEPFGDGGRMTTPFAYWLLASDSTPNRPEVARFVRWVLDQAAATRAALASPSRTGPSSVTTAISG